MELSSFLVWPPSDCRGGAGTAHWLIFMVISRHAITQMHRSVFVDGYAAAPQLPPPIFGLHSKLQTKNINYYFIPLIFAWPHLFIIIYFHHHLHLLLLIFYLVFATNIIYSCVCMVSSSLAALFLPRSHSPAKKRPRFSLSPHVKLMDSFRSPDIGSPISLSFSKNDIKNTRFINCLFCLGPQKWSWASVSEYLHQGLSLGWLSKREVWVAESKNGLTRKSWCTVFDLTLQP